MGAERVRKRVRKEVGSDATDYVIFNGQTIAEHAPNGDWSDYVYAGSKRIVRADDHEDFIRTTGNCTSCGSQWADFSLGTAGYSGYVIQSGDKIFFRQWQANGGRGGLLITAGSASSVSLNDQDGIPLNADTYSNTWHFRRADLSSLAGNALSSISLRAEGPSGSGWTVDFREIVLVSTDGTVKPIYTRQPSVSVTTTSSSGMSSLSAQVIHWGSPSPEGAPLYYHGDHLGSARLLSGYSGYPIATYTYGPYGEEFNPQTTVNHYKFTGKERDSESGLDNFGARYMSSSQGRFVTPDPSNLSVDFWLPQTWNRYSYVLNNPLSMKDENGLWPWPIHDRIIDQAFPGLRAQQLQILKDASWNMDYRPGQQSAPLSFQHGMRDGLNNQSASDAERDSDGFIAENEHEAKNIQAQWIASGHTGISPLALAAFGNALHTVTDRTSPAHEGYQPWFGTKWWQKKSLKHFRQEANPWHPNVITAVRAAQDEFVRTFGFGWNQMDLIGLQQRQEVTHRICFTDERGKKICE